MCSSRCKCVACTLVCGKRAIEMTVSCEIQKHSKGVGIVECTACGWPTDISRKRSLLSGIIAAGASFWIKSKSLDNPLGETTLSQCNLSPLSLDVNTWVTFCHTFFMQGNHLDCIWLIKSSLSSLSLQWIEILSMWIITIRVELKNRHGSYFKGVSPWQIRCSVKYSKK